MKDPGAGTRRGGLATVLTTMVILSGILVGGTLLRMQSVGDRITERNLRDLARIARAVEGRLNNVHTVLRNATRDRVDEDSIQAKVRLAPGLGAVSVYIVPGTASEGRGSADSLTDATCPSSGDTRPRTVLCRIADGRLHVAHFPELPDTLAALRVETSFDLSALGSTLDSEYFSAVLLAQNSGRVVVPAIREQGVLVQDLRGLEVETDSGDVTLEDPGTTGIHTVRIAGRPFLLYQQPLDLSLDLGPSTDGSWSVSGLLRQDRYRQERLALGPGPALTLGLLVVFGFLIAPFITVAGMGPRERLRVRHLLYLVLSMVLTGGFLGLWLGDVAQRRPFQRAYEEGADSVAALLARNLSNEIDAGLAELDHKSGLLCDAVVLEWETAAPHFDSLGSLQETGITPGTYPLYQSVFWTDREGAQRAKWTPRKTNTPLVDVASRAYVREILAGRGWDPPPGETTAPAESPSEPRCEPVKTEFYLESVRSITTGEHLAVLSRPFQWPVAPSRDTTANGVPKLSRGVAAMVTSLASLTTPVLPAEMQFAVVTSEGETVFHSLEERNLEEDFLSETGNDRRVASTLRARTSRAVEGHYRERRSRLVIHPLPGTPLSVVLVVDRAPLETARFEAWFVGLALLLGYTFLLVIWFTFLEATVRTRVHWAWPDLARPGKHSAVTTLFLALLVEMVAHAFLASHSAPHGSSLLVPFQGLGLSMVLLSLPDRRYPRPPSFREAGSLRAFAMHLVAWLPPTRQGRSVFRAQSLGWGLWGGATLIMIVAHVVRPAPLVLTIVHLAVTAWSFYYVRSRAPRLVEPHQGPTKIRYEVSMALGLALVAVAPGFLFYQWAFGEHSGLVQRHNVMVVAEQLGDREIRLAQAFNDSAATRLDSAGVRVARWMDVARVDLTFAPLFNTRYGPIQDGATLRPDFDPDRGLRSFADSLDCARDTVDKGAGTELSRAVADRIPWLTEVAVSMRQLSFPGEGRCIARAIEGGDSRWSQAQPYEAADVLVLRDDLFWVTSRLVGRDGASWIERVLVERRWLTVRWLLFLVGSAAGVFLILRWLARRVFLIDLGAPPAATLGEAMGREINSNTIFVCMRSTDRGPVRGSPSEHRQYVDLMAVPVTKSGEPVLPYTMAKTMCVDHLDHRIGEPEWSARVLWYLERLVYVEGKRVLLLTSREPEEIFAPGPSDDTDDLRLLRHRWSRLLGQFARVAVADRATEGELEVKLRETRESRVERAVERAQGRGLPSRREAREEMRKEAEATCLRFDALLVQECGTSHRLHEVALTLSDRDDYTELHADELEALILECATPLYRAIWTVLGRGERLVLAQLAAGATVNPKSFSAIRRLVARGLLVRDPELRFLNRSFRSFVREAVPEERLVGWERSGSPSTWAQIRLPLLLVWMGLVLFLLWTQRNVLGDAVALVGSAGAGMAAVIRLVTLFEKGPSSKEVAG